MAPQDFKRQMSEHGYETVMNHSTRTHWYAGVGLQGGSHQAEDEDQDERHSRQSEGA